MDRGTPRPQALLFVISVIFFVAGSALCGIAGNLGEMVASRIIQGAAGVVVAPRWLGIRHDVWDDPSAIVAARLQRYLQAASHNRAMLRAVVHVVMAAGRERRSRY
jgi:MFS family permease